MAKDFAESAGESNPVHADCYLADVSMADYIRMPRELTAENGAKALLIGEFHIKVEHIDRETDEPYVQEHPIPWPTIKAIYKMAAEHLAK